MVNGDDDDDDDDDDGDDVGHDDDEERCVKNNELIHCRSWAKHQHNYQTHVSVIQVEEILCGPIQ